MGREDGRQRGRGRKRITETLCLMNHLVNYCSDLCCIWTSTQQCECSYGLMVVLLQYSTAIFGNYTVQYSTVVLYSIIHYSTTCKGFANKSKVKLQFLLMLLCSKYYNVHALYNSSFATKSFNDLVTGTVTWLLNEEYLYYDMCLYQLSVMNTYHA